MSTEDTIQIDSLTIPPEEQTPLVLALLEIIRQQDEEEEKVTATKSTGDKGTWAILSARFLLAATDCFLVWKLRYGRKKHLH